MCRARSRTKQVTRRQGLSIASLEPRVLSVHVSVLRCSYDDLFGFHYYVFTGDIEISPLDEFDAPRTAPLPCHQHNPI